MLSQFPQAMPLEGFLGGFMIGIAAAVMLLGLGQIAGVSGLAARSIGLSGSNNSRLIAICFVLGLPLGALIISFLSGPLVSRFPESWLTLVLGAVFVGIGTRLGSGCTSGHGVCGLSRLSRRSIIATALFIASGIVTVTVMRMAGWS